MAATRRRISTSPSRAPSPCAARLQQSLNVPAVAVLEEVGPSRLIARLGEAGASLVLPRREAPGLALGLGGVGIRLVDLTMLYAGLARGRERCSPSPSSSRRRARAASACSSRWRPGMSPTCCKARRRRRTQQAGASPSRPARATAIAMPGRSASTESTRSVSGSAGPTARRSCGLVGTHRGCAGPVRCVRSRRAAPGAAAAGAARER